MSAQNLAQEPLEPIVGSKLSAVVFVMDYVQLQFDGPVLTAVTSPVVTVGNTQYKWGQPGYRDMLCERITKIVCSTSVKEGDEIRIDFNDGSIISVSLKPEDYCRPEAAIFHSAPKHLWVW